MHYQLQATWTPSGDLYFWTLEEPLDDVVNREFPGLRKLDGRPHQARLVGPTARRDAVGLLVPWHHVLPLLVHLPPDAAVSDSIRCYSLAAKLGIRLAAGQLAIPDVVGGEARWRALVLHAPDQAALSALIQGLPVWARAWPTDEGTGRIPTASRVVRWAVDRTVDTLYRRGVWPGPARGWARDLGEALIGPDARYAPREARHQAVPEVVHAWASEADQASLDLEIRLDLPNNPSTPLFPLTLQVVNASSPATRVSVRTAWSAGEVLVLDRVEHEHPGLHAIRALARAARIWPTLSRSLTGTEPNDLELDAETTWSFLDRGAPALRDAGFRVRVPAEFETSGSRRIRARMSVDAPSGGRMNLEGVLSFRWEVALGERVIDGATFAALLAQNSPIVRLGSQWVVLDPAEVARLPKDMSERGTLPVAAALRAVLVGEHEGIPVVANDRLSMLVEALRQPPEVPTPPGFQGSLRPYQERGYHWLVALGRMGLGCCLADDMGLGKTVQVIAHLAARRERPHLVVCPTSVLGNWEREILRFAPGLRVARYHGLQRSTSALRRSDVVLTSYGLLARDLDVLGAIRWDVAVLDEAQSIKNPESRRAKSARQLKANHRIALSGTPVENRLDELWSLMEYIIPGMLGPRKAFQRNVAVPIERFGDEEVARQLKIGVSPFLLRRLKSDPTIINDLPDKVERREYTPLTPEQARLYKQVVEEFMERIENAEDSARRGHVLAMLTALKQICNHPDQYLKQDGTLDGRSGKLERFGEIMEQVLDIGDRVLVFTQYREMGARLQRWMAEALGVRAPFLHGGTPAPHREEMVRAFQEDERAPPVLVVSLRAGGTGLNLTRATHVIHYDRWWNPAVEDQATDRAYRIGQHRNVQVYKLVCQGTLEERIDALLDEKRALAEQVVGSGETWVSQLDDSALRALVTLGDDAIVEEA